MSSPFGKRRLQVVSAFIVTAGLAGCTSLPSWTGLHLPADQTSNGQPVTYPDLAQIPERPVALDSPDQRQEQVRLLTEDRARTAQAGEALRREIETDFQQPEPPSEP